MGLRSYHDNKLWSKEIEPKCKQSVNYQNSPFKLLFHNQNISMIGFSTGILCEIKT